MKISTFFHRGNLTPAATLGPFWYLRSTPLFGMLCDSELTQMSEQVRMEIAVHKNVFSYSDDPKSKMFFRRHGHSARREEYASVIDKATICIFEKADFERALRGIPSMHHQVFAVMAERVERMSERLVDMHIRTAHERILGFLLRTR